MSRVHAGVCRKKRGQRGQRGQRSTARDRVRALIARMGWGCYPSPDATEEDWRRWLASLGVVETRVCAECGEPMEKRSGRYGPFWGCSGYPDCRYTESVSGGNGR
jgi:hypothetical protein